MNLEDSTRGEPAEPDVLQVAQDSRNSYWRSSLCGNPSTIVPLYGSASSASICRRDCYAHSDPQAVYHTTTAYPMDRPGRATTGQRDTALALPSAGAPA